MTKPFKYKAYISYSHRDESWAKWLHRSLESYRIPRKLVGTKTATGKVPGRVKPVFRDRDDLSSASDLGGTVQEALEDSANMIVICSPEAAASHWVNEEIRHFASLGREKQIFCVIVDGDPAMTGTESGCFPAALAEIGMKEPLAADVRKWADGKRLSRLKLVAGMLGLPLDQLRRRDLQKRQKAWAWMSVAAVLLSIVVISAITSRIAAQQRRISGESLVVYKLNELRTMLNVTVDFEGLERFQQLNERGLGNDFELSVDDQTLIDQALEFREQGTAAYDDDALDEALEAYERSWFLIAEVYRRDKGNQEAFFELGQAEFYIGQVYLDLGDIDKAEEAFMSYAEITRRLIVEQPENAEWVLEMAYALTNLGSLNQKREETNPERTLQLMQSALEYNQIALVLDPQNEYYRSELGQSHAFLADAQLGVCDLEGGLKSRQQNISLDTDILVADPDNGEKKKRLAWAWSGLGTVQEKMGLVQEATISFENNLALTKETLNANPDDKYSLRNFLNRQHRVLILKTMNGNLGEISRSMDSLNKEWQNSYFLKDTTDSHAQLFFASFLIDWAWLAQQMAEPAEAEKRLDDSLAMILDVQEKLPDSKLAGNLLMAAAFQYWEMKNKYVEDSILLKLPYYWGDSGQSWSCSDASMAVRKAVMLGDMGRATQLTSYLLGRGYRESRFIRVCRRHNLCEEQ